jgi:hypothetical protein
VRAILRRLVVIAGILTLWPASAHAITIVSVSGSGQPTGFLLGTSGGTPSTEQILAVSWNQSESYTDVVITALLSGFFRGVAHLSTTLGPGTTTAQEVAADDFLVQLNTADRDDIPLLSGLTLGPGSYFLTLEPESGSSGNWWLETSVIELDAGVSLNQSVGSTNADIDQAFAPASTFSIIANGLPFSYAVTGNRVDSIVSEPRGGLLFASALVGLGLAIRRRGARAAQSDA